MVSLCQAAAIDGSATPVATTDAPVRRGLNPVCAPAAVGSPMGVDSPVDDVDFDTLEPRERADSLDSLDSLLHDRANDDSEMELSDATDSGAEDSDALLEFDDYCLDYLLEILGSSDCAVDVAL
ncbi:hypothetical protein PybrP1_007881 [[Pythium] brassicae (nom. inval.)]|nr:hypothetical protein PybrP1_007881 [[Pythium] brassicae (nom. inval.)]